MEIPKDLNFVAYSIFCHLPPQYDYSIRAFNRKLWPYMYQRCFANFLQSFLLLLYTSFVILSYANMQLEMHTSVHVFLLETPN